MNVVLIMHQDFLENVNFMKKILVLMILSLFSFSLSYSLERDFQPVAKVNGELYLLDYKSIKAGDKDMIKYVQLISFKKKQETSNGKKYYSVQMYMEAKCALNMIKPYILQYYDVKMEDGNVMKGNIVRTADFAGDWITPKKGTAYDVVMKEACETWLLVN